MLHRINLTYVGIGVGVLFWMFESILHAYFLAERSFAEALIPSNGNEWWMRILISAGFALFGFYANFELGRKQVLTHALANREQRLKSIIDSAYDAYISIDAAGTITGWNRKAEEMFGWSQAQAIGQPLHELIIPKLLRRRHLKGMHNYLHNGTGPWLYKPVQTQALCKDGHEITVELVIVPLAPESGIVEFFAFIRAGHFNAA